MSKYVVVILYLIVLHAIQIQSLCSPRCLNGGECNAGNTCDCLVGFTGSSCTTKINFCLTDKDGNVLVNSPCIDNLIGNCLPIFASNANSIPGVACVANNAGGRCFSAQRASKTGPFALQCQVTA